MENKSEKNDKHTSGTDFKKHQSAVDKGLNERIKNESGDNAADADVNRNEKRNHSSDLSQKKTGGGKQKSIGD